MDTDNTNLAAEITNLWNKVAANLSIIFADGNMTVY